MFNKLTELTGVMNQAFTSTRARLEKVFTSLGDHVLDTRNPHATDKTDVGLSKVQNYAPATKQQSINGKNNNAVVTPLRVDQYMDAKVYTPLTQLFDDAINQLDE